MSSNLPSSFKPRKEIHNSFQPINKETSNLPSSFTSRKTIQQKEDQESFASTIGRYVSQVPLGYAQGTPLGVLSNISNFIGTGDALDPEEIEHIKAISEREGIPFDEEKYYKAVENASKYFPTVGNLARMAEEQTGLPLEAKTRGQKFVEFASAAGRLIPAQGAKVGAIELAPKGHTFRGMNTALQRPILGTGVAATKEALTEAGVPEPVSELASFLVLKEPTGNFKSLEFGKKTKPSGLPERGFEKLKSTRELTPEKLEQINTKVNEDFKTISDKIISESPVGETFNELKNNPTYKRESKELLDQAQIIADNLPGEHSSLMVKNNLIKRGNEAKNLGYMPNESQKQYIKFVQEMVNDIPDRKLKPAEWVKQYRSNNAELSQYFEPGQSKGYNRAKRDALLDHNRAIADAMKEAYPNSDLVKVFEEGNQRWSKIMDAEAIDEFINEIFKEKIDFKKAKDFFDKEGISRPFTRSLGEKGYQEFETLMKDLTSSEVPYKMLKVAKNQGWDSLFKSAIGYMIHPKIGAAKGALDTAKLAYKRWLNVALDKPQFAFKLKQGVENIKKGKFAEATKDFEAIQGELQMPKEASKKSAKETPIFETKVEKVQTPRNIERENKLIGEKPKSNSKKDIINFDSMGTGMIDNLYEGLFDSLKKGKDTYAGIKDPFLQAAKPSYDKGLIKNVEDLKQFSKFYKENSKRKL